MCSAASPVVVDVGTYCFKLGLAGQQDPKIVRLPDDTSIASEFWLEQLEVELELTRSTLAERPFLLGVTTSATRRHREKLCEIVFENLGAPALCIARNAFLSIVGAGLSTALVLDVGESAASATPVEDGYPHQQCAVTGGPEAKLLNDAMATMMQEALYKLPDSCSWSGIGR